jgi:site-specific recombinase XerD
VQGQLYSLAQEYLLFLEAERGYSPLTVSSYRSDLSQLFRHLQQLGAPEGLPGLTLPNARSWLVAMHRAGLSPNTVARRVAALRGFSRYLSDEGYSDRDVCARLSSPARVRSMPQCLSAEELTALRLAALRQRVAYNAFRDHAIITLAVFTGLRRGELLGLQMGDVDLSQGVLRVQRGKGRKSRVVPLVGDVVEALGDWLTFRRTKGTDRVFTTIRGNRIYPSRLQVIWRAVLGRSGVTRPGVTLHTLRHSVATLLLQSGKVDLVAIQHLLGHSRLDTTGLYLHMDDAGLREAVEAHPLCRSGD